MSDFIPDPKFPVSGVACIPLSPDSKKVFAVEGDRHFLSGTLKEAWEAIFHPAFEEAGKALITGAPVQVITVKENLEFLGETYGPLVQAGAIAQYCVSKGIFPTCCFTQKVALQIAKQESYAYTIETSQLLKFHAQLMDFTARVAFFYEFIFGAVDGAPTEDPKTIRDTLHRESYEEFNLSTELLRNAQFLCYGKPRQNRAGETVVTAYFIVCVAEQVMLDAWHAKMLRDRPTGNEWRCPLSWYKFLPDIDLAAGKRAKAHLETGPKGGWHPMGVHPNMDDKNRELIELYTLMRLNAPEQMHVIGAPRASGSLGRSATGSEIPVEDPAASEPASKRQRENPQEDVVDGLGDVNARAAAGSSTTPSDPAAERPREPSALAAPVPGSLDEFVANTLAAGSLGIFGPAGVGGGRERTARMKLHLMVNDGSVTPLLPQGDEPKLPSHPVPLGTKGFYMDVPAVVTYYDKTLPSQYAPAGDECLLTVNWEGERVRIPKTFFFRELGGAMWE